MPKFDPLRFIADYAGMSLVDAISAAYRHGQQDAQHVPGTNGGDTISRQAAIDEICDIRCGKSRFDCESYKNRNYISDCDYIRSLLNLPSTQPKIIRCEDCKYWMPYDWMFSEICRSKNMNDYSEDEIGCTYCDMNMDANGFCSRAEGRADDKQRRN